MSRNWKLAAGGLVAAAGLAVPASASAAITASPFQACYAAGTSGGVASIPVSLSGGTPGDLWQIVASYPNSSSGSAGSTDGDDAPFDGNGDASGTLTNIFPDGDPAGPIKGRTVDVSVEDFPQDDSAPTTTPVGSFLVTNTALDVNFGTSNPKAERAVTVSGTQFAGKQVYGFITNKAGTKVLRTFHLGKGDVCGYTTHKEIVAPSDYKTGVYRLFVVAGDKLVKSAALSSEFQVYKF
jgi:hypothetical protein